MKGGRIGPAAMKRQKKSRGGPSGRSSQLLSTEKAARINKKGNGLMHRKSGNRRYAKNISGNGGERHIEGSRRQRLSFV